MFTSGQKNIHTTIHELGHALGMAHNCGNRDYTGKKRCAEQYDALWLVDPTNKLIQNSTALAFPESFDYCAPHIITIRQAHLEDDNNFSRELLWK